MNIEDDIAHVKLLLGTYEQDTPTFYKSMDNILNEVERLIIVEREIVVSVAETTKQTAERCAELAAIFDHDKCFWNEEGSDAIRKAFNL